MKKRVLWLLAGLVALLCLLTVSAGAADAVEASNSGHALVLALGRMQAFSNTVSAQFVFEDGAEEIVTLHAMHDSYNYENVPVTPGMIANYVVVDGTYILTKPEQGIVTNVLEDGTIGVKNGNPAIDGAYIADENTAFVLGSIDYATNVRNFGAYTGIHRTPTFTGNNSNIVYAIGDNGKVAAVFCTDTIILGGAGEKVPTIDTTISTENGITPTFTIDTSALYGTDNYAVITMGDKTQRVEQSQWADGKVVYDGVAMKDLTQTVTMGLYDAEGNLLTEQSICVYDALKARLDAETNVQKKAEYTAQLHLAAAAQKYFDHNTENLADKDLDSTVGDMSAHRKDKSSLSGKNTSVIYGTSCVLGNTLQMKLYFTANDKTVFVNGSEVTLTASPTEGYYYYVMDVEPEDIFANVSIQVKDGNTVLATATDSIASYCARLYVKGGEKNETMADALLNYGVAAKVAETVPQTVMVLYKTGNEALVTAGINNQYSNVAAVVDGRVTTVKVTPAAYAQTNTAWANGNGFRVVSGGEVDSNGNYSSLTDVVSSGEMVQISSFTTFGAYADGIITLDTAKYVDAAVPVVVWNTAARALQITTVDAVQAMSANTTGYYTTDWATGAITGIYMTVDY